VALDVDRDELAGQGPRGYKGKGTARREEEDGEDEGIATLQKKVAANMEGDLGVVESEDDEEIESDDAFEGESDEERFRGFKFKEKVHAFF
jgi:U3 small nucleolar RNA-associated protein 14